MKITEKEIRAKKGCRHEGGYTHFWCEVLVDGEWKKVYLVDKTNLNWYESDFTIINPTKEEVKISIEVELDTINYYLSHGYKLVSYEEFKRVINKYFDHGTSLPNEIYL